MVNSSAKSEEDEALIVIQGTDICFAHIGGTFLTIFIEKIQCFMNNLRNKTAKMSARQFCLSVDQS